ncbi:MAG: helix-turn-helix transcriptional regulator [Bradyrhizobium sp.]|uniref:TetR/AcrR family transcriptional regulator n=1 Tax=Bradyrhizobium sp. TaxID=376 RepID=UPI0025BA6372|nr:helix-turn-helix domain-containing protein [Bradyrhizobium sp.]MBI5264031.1 helix-turn-helix transcriptional regulator [Bradyrhizobium sp.]
MRAVYRIVRSIDERLRSKRSRPVAKRVRQQARTSGHRDRLLDTAIRLYRETGYEKTTVADIARGASMSPANDRFFPSRQTIEEAVVAMLLDEVATAAKDAARRGGGAAHFSCESKR